MSCCVIFVHMQHTHQEHLFVCEAKREIPVDHHLDVTTTNL